MGDLRLRRVRSPHGVRHSTRADKVNVHSSLSLSVNSKGESTTVSDFKQCANGECNESTLMICFLVFIYIPPPLMPFFFPLMVPFGGGDGPPLRWTTFIKVDKRAEGVYRLRSWRAGTRGAAELCWNGTYLRRPSAWRANVRRAGVHRDRWATRGGELSN